MNLTAEEKALIEQKRAEKIAEEKAKLASYDHHKETVINRENTRISQYEKDEVDRKRVYEDVYAQLTAISPDYKLGCEKVNQVNNVDVYDVDENGYEIRTKKNKKGETIWLKPKEVLKFKFYRYNLKISYTGKVPEGHNYYVVPVSQYSKWSYRITGYKMQVQGTGVSSWDKRGQMTNAKSVHKKITETVDNAFKQIEYKTAQEQSNNRIKEKFKAEFSQYGGEQVKYGSTNEFIVTLDNGIKVTFYGHEDSEGNITFNNAKVSVPYRTIEVKDLLNGLNDIKGKE